MVLLLIEFIKDFTNLCVIYGHGYFQLICWPILPYFFKGIILQIAFGWHVITSIICSLHTCGCSMNIYFGD